MNNVVGMTAVSKAGGAQAVEDPSGTTEARPALSATELLPAPFTPAATDDLMTTLALAMLQQKHEDRVQSDAQSRAAARAQEEAHARKIEKMHELADDTFAEGLVEGITEGVGAAATGISACVKYGGETKLIDARQVGRAAPDIDVSRLERTGQGWIRNAALIEASGTGARAAGKFVESAYKRSQELDRADMAVIDREIDRAKGTAESASAQSRRDQDDMRDTISAFRAFSNAKTQLQQSMILRA